MKTNDQQPLRIACVGEAMIEVSVSTAHNENEAVQTRLGFAGDTLNTAIYLKRIIGDAAQVSYITRVGKDVFSDQLLEFIQAEAISTHAIERCSTKIPGLYAITTDTNGERSFTYWRDSSAARDLFQTPQGFSFDTLSQFDVIFFSGISLAILPTAVRDAWIDWLRDFREQTNATIVFDSNYRPRLWESIDEARHYMNQAWSVSTLALPSVDDEQLLHGDATDADVIFRIRQLGVQDGVLKRGHQGPLNFDDTESPCPASATVNVVDTTAAGDSFNGAYIASRLQGKTQQEAILAGHSCAVKVIGHRGAIIPAEHFF